MKLTIEIEIDEDEYKKAVCAGWDERFDEEIDSGEVTGLTNPGDFQWAVKHIPTECIKLIIVKK